MKTRHGSSLALAVLALSLAACASNSDATGATTPSSSIATTDPSGTPPVVDLTGTILDILAGTAKPFAKMERGTYALDPDLDPATPMRVTFDVTAEGWRNWLGATKSSDDGWVMVSIATVSNLVTQGCRDHAWADPPIGAGVDDLAAALADLAPFRVTSPPTDVTVHGYSGTHLKLVVPNLPVDVAGDDRRFTGCEEGTLKSWVAAIDTEPGDAFYGYNAEPGRTEEFWILDVDGTRLMIEANWSPASPRKDVAEMRAVLDSIRIEP